MPNPSTDCAWEDARGLVHWVPYTIGDRYTACDTLRIAWHPGVWSDLPVTCLACLVDTKRLKGKVSEQVPPMLRREAGLFMFRWPFRTTGGIVHGALVPTRDYSVDQTRTLCGLSTLAKRQKGTGRWTHGRESMTCIGCLSLLK